MQPTHGVSRRSRRPSPKPVPAIAIAVAFSTIATLACDDEPMLPQFPPPASITIDPETALLTGVDDTVKLTARVLDEHERVIAGFPVSWSSSNVAVATVGPSGWVHAAADGEATDQGCGGFGFRDVGDHGGTRSGPGGSDIAVQRRRWTPIGCSAGIG